MRHALDGVAFRQFSAIIWRAVVLHFPDLCKSTDSDDDILSKDTCRFARLMFDVLQIRDEGVVTTRTQSNEFRVVTSSNEYLSPRNIVTEYLSSND